MVNIDINQKSIEKESRPKHDSRKQLPQETSSKSKNPHEPEGTSSKPNDLSENGKKISKEHTEEKEALIVGGVALIIAAGIYFFK